MSKKIKPLEVVLIGTKLCVKVLKFETLKTELKRKGETWFTLLTERCIFTDHNGNVITLNKAMVLSNAPDDHSSEKGIEELFEKYFMHIRVKVYVVILDTLEVQNV